MAKFKIRSLIIDDEAHLGGFDRMKLAELRKWLSRATLDLEEVK